MEVVIWFVGMLGGMLLVFAFMRGGKKPLEVQLSLMNEEVIRLREKEQQLQNEKLQLISETERLKESGRQMEEKLTFQKQEMGEIREMMTAQFRNLASEILEDKSRRFTETNRENIEKILQPLNKDIAEFRKKVDEAYYKEATERTVLERKIAELVQLNNQIRVDAVNLTNALKGNVKTQGDWGEMILERILENSGLAKGREYFVQETLKDENNRVLHNENGGMMRPDVMIVYPDNRRVIIDSKVSLTAYVNYCNSETDAMREVALKEHLHSVRKHVDELANKNYDSWVGGTLDFVMMFIPNEASYVLAMQHDSSLWSDAYRKRVLLLSPANLIASLKLTADLWSREYQNRNALEIADRGAKLYDKCVSFLESFTSIGDSIRKTQTVYEQALGRLSTGGGNLISQTLKLRELGVKSKKGEKEIPKELLPDEEQESQK
ncbi:DNA recombination protein RmuC [Bacteroides acidifaciens]|uniref:DNA recombination protein RmuC n=1 Tax=Bacteroides acidifaciens TaxID=85831 RepID=UPI002557FBE8|nr:DNA recombination protein RmuC [Bacteroides acidifaciens]